MAATTGSFEYATYTEKPETCPSCASPIPLDQLARRGTRVGEDSRPKVAYWHIRCVEADGSRR
ncbi:hypothetical protein [Streptomyces nitrosporeus]|uniref:hypothetical protein n=1 Tax=Streptomyces nitrosporeus TaxID=28894 RepID=UPI00332694DB